VAWLAQLPALVADVAARWSLTILPPFPELSYNYVAPVVGPGGEAWVLKAGVPHRELSDEAEALRLYNGRGITRLVAEDRERGVLLLERAQPGGSLRGVTGDEAQVAVLAAVWRTLSGRATADPVTLPPDHPFRTIAQLARGLDRLRETFGGTTGPFPAGRVARAEALFRELTASAAPPQLIHGDLNPGNVLRAERAPWLAIDPKGYAGDPLWDVATYLNDPPVGLSPDDLRRLQARRVALLAEALSTPREAILAWAEAHAVLSAWWYYEDHGAWWEPGMALAGMYASLQHRAA
jgi:streptomycin 6-kinase